jgi:hypothetical protein
MATATISDVKDLLLRGLDPRNTVNRLNAMLASPVAKKTESTKPEEPKKTVLKKKST